MAVKGWKERLASTSRSGGKLTVSLRTRAHLTLALQMHLGATGWTACAAEPLSYWSHRDPPGDGGRLVKGDLVDLGRVTLQNPGAACQTFCRGFRLRKV